MSEMNHEIEMENILFCEVSESGRCPEGYASIKLWAMPMLKLGGDKDLISLQMVICIGLDQCKMNCLEIENTNICS